MSRIFIRRRLFITLFLYLGLSWIDAQSLEEKQTIVNGNQFYLNQEFDKARVEYSKVLAQTPSHLKANYNLGNTFYQLKDYKKSLLHYQKAAEMAIDNIDKAAAFHNLGNSYMHLQQFDKAVEAYKNALRKNPKDDETRYNFALAKKLLNNQQQKQQNQTDLPQPSVYAKEQKAIADSLSEKAMFTDALQIMNQALDKDSTVIHFQSFIEKLNQIVILDTIQWK
ncbi:MAG: tetratricopeptide repeat protein [Flavobacteriaceae bacterium]|nr:tetratricopeptide repeat protein [Flavobacteriaceae bacterium]